MGSLQEEGTPRIHGLDKGSAAHAIMTEMADVREP
jgi:hypothetical protein